MEKKLKQILGSIDEAILTYEGENLYEDGLLDSFQIVDLVVALEEAFDIEIDPEWVVLENFANWSAIMNLLQQIKEETK